MQRHVMSKHHNVGLTPFQTVPFSKKCQRFRFEHPFTSMIAGMTGSGKTAWVRSLLQQASETIYPPPERIVWCYSQWQPAYTEMLVAMPHIEFVKGIPTALEQDSYFDLQNRYLAFKEQLNTRTRPEESTVPDLTSSTQDSSTATAAFSTPINPFNVTPKPTQATILQKPENESSTQPLTLNPAFLTPPPTVETPSQGQKRKRRRIQ
ncbi:unnamed protein product, partial [Porites evermanni]